MAIMVSFSGEASRKPSTVLSWPGAASRASCRSFSCASAGRAALRTGAVWLAVNVVMLQAAVTGARKRKRMDRTVGGSTTLRQHANMPELPRSLLIALLVLAPACDALDLLAERPARVEPAKTQTLIAGKPGDAIGLDPARISDRESAGACEQIYEHLYVYAPGSTERVPQLATGYDVDPLGVVWTFHLRAGVRFHDGTPLDADAVVFSFERQRDPFHPQHEADFVYWSDQ